MRLGVSVNRNVNQLKVMIYRGTQLHCDCERDVEEELTVDTGLHVIVAQSLVPGLEHTLPRTGLVLIVAHQFRCINEREQGLFDGVLHVVCVIACAAVAMVMVVMVMVVASVLLVLIMAACRCSVIGHYCFR